MAWDKPQYSRKKVNWAGGLRIGQIDSALDWALSEQIINNWRRSHNFPLTITRTYLDRKVKRIESGALVFQRTKRMPSIERKLRDEPSMALSTMQDIGGCRVVVSDIAKVYRLAQSLEKDTDEKTKVRDYIQKPKPCGYRSLHMVRKFRSEKHPEYNDLRIETQIRSQSQHAWATAFEVVEYLTGRTLRRSQEEGDWRRFFLLMSASLALKERTAPVPETPSDPVELKRELTDSARRVDVLQRLTNFSTLFMHVTDKHIREHTRSPYYFLLCMSLHPVRGAQLQFAPFKRTQLDEAMRAYEDAESQKDKEAVSNIVLVSVKSPAALRRAYPNYFADTGRFVEELRAATS